MQFFLYNITACTTVQAVMIELYFYLSSKCPKWCAQTLHQFSQILKIFSGIRAPIVAPPSNNFQICLFRWNGFSYRKKELQTASKSANKCRRYLLLNNALPCHLGPWSVRKLPYLHTNTQKVKTSHFILSCRHALFDFNQTLRDDR